MGEKGNVPADAAAASLASRAGSTASDLAGAAATKSVEIGVEGVAHSLRRDDEETVEQDPEPDPGATAT